MPIVANRMAASERVKLAAGELRHDSKATPDQIVQSRLATKPGEPGTWTRQMNVQNAPLTVRIRGRCTGLALLPPPP